MAIKPANHISWTDGDSAKQVEPSVAKKLLGWVALERPPFEFMNHLFFRLDEWQEYFEEVTDGLLALQSTFDIVIGTGGTHADLNAAIAAVALTNQRVLVIDPSTITTTQVLSRDGWEIHFKPIAVYSQGLTTTPGIDITGDRVKIIGGRFTDFDGGSDVAINVSGTASNTFIDRTFFANVDTDINDVGVNTTIGNIVNEV